MFDAQVQRRQTAIPTRQVPAGMYPVKRPSSYPLIEYYGVLVTGNLVSWGGALAVTIWLISRNQSE